MKGIATLEWIVIAAIVLLMVAGAVEVWQGAWEPAMAKAVSASGSFESAISSI